MSRVFTHLAVVALLSLPLAATQAEQVKPGPILKEGVIPSDWPQPKAAADGAPTLVMLPVQIEVDDVERYAAVGELLCDALAAQLSATGKMHFVDRAQVDRLLAEQELDSDRVRALTSFDAMVRLDVRPQALLPSMKLDVIDISTGNPLAEVTLDWPLDEQAVPKMVTACVTAAEKVAGQESDDERRTRVRLLGPICDARQPRLASLAAKMRRLLEQSLDTSEQIERVRHLESGSAKQESLFLLMGLSKLEGGRQFVPNADATIELEMEEVDAVGKTFEETPIRVRARVRQGDALAGDWETTQHSVRDFETLSTEVWAKLAGQLATVDHNAAAEVIKSDNLRRKLAEAELQAKVPVTNSEIDRMVAQIEIAEAALKIDPTYDAARFQLLDARRHLVNYYITPALNGTVPLSVALDANDRFLTELLTCAQQPSVDCDPLKGAFDAAFLTIRITPLYKFNYPLEAGLKTDLQRRRYEAERQSALKAVGELTQDDQRRIMALRQVVDLALSDPRTAAVALQGTIRIVARGMDAFQVPQHARVNWLVETAARCSTVNNNLSAVAPRDREYTASSMGRNIHLIVDLLVEADARQVAGRVLLENRDMLQHLLRKDQQHFDATLASIGDATVTARVLGKNVPLEHPREPVGLLATPDNIWPQPQLVADNLQVPHVWMQTPPLVPLAGHANRMYVLVGDATQRISWTHGAGASTYLQDMTVMYHKLDDEGRPAGPVEQHSAQDRRFKLQNALQAMPQPKVEGGYGQIMSRVLDSKLYLSTTTSGLLVFDPDRNSWTQHNTESGLPTNEIHSFFPVGNGTLLCTGKVTVSVVEGVNTFHNVHFILDMKSGEARLLRKRDVGQPPWYAPRLTHVWRHDGRWNGLAPWHHYEGLLDDNLKTTRNSIEPVDAVEIGGRQFFSTVSGLYEFDASGKVICDWKTSGGTTIQVGPRSRHGFAITHLPDSPVEGRYLAHSGGMLFMTQSNRRIVAYDPTSDTWFGPWAPILPVQHMGAASEGVWLTASRGTFFVHAEDFRKAAIDSGHACTTKEFRERQQNAVAAGNVFGPRINLEKGRPQFPDHGQDQDWQHGLLAMRAREWSTAAAAFDRALESYPDNAYALLFAGIVRDRWCLKKPDEALAYYEKLAQHENRDAAFTGVYWAMQNRMAQRQHGQVSELAAGVERDFPQISNQEIAADINHWKQEAQRQLK